MSKDKLGNAARSLGVQHGAQRASWIINDLDKRVSKMIVAGYERGEQEVMDFCPGPFSGEDGDDPKPMYILDQIANEAGKSKGNGNDDLLEVYEKAFTKTFWILVVQEAKDIISGKENRP